MVYFLARLPIKLQCAKTQIMQNSTREWKKIIWHEWRYCHDIDYEERLFKLVGSDSPG